jgi:hypothetical protein|tara:strand:+ start:2050 stop:2262 length:213 start_codon:yes stop_codon:yes gene_type:complete
VRHPGFGSRLDEALQLITAVYQLMPFSSNLNDWRGHIHFQLDDYDNTKIFLIKASNWAQQEDSRKSRLTS